MYTEIASTALYTCCRDGREKENRLPKKTSQTRKHRGSRKVEGYCISRMMVTRENSGKVPVKYQCSFVRSARSAVSFDFSISV